MNRIVSVEQLEALPVGSWVKFEARWHDGSGPYRDDVCKIGPDEWEFLIPDWPVTRTSHGLFHYADGRGETTITTKHEV